MTFPTSTGGDVHERLREFVGGIDESRTAPIVNALCVAVFAGVPEMAADAGVRALTTESIRQNVQSLIRMAMPATERGGDRLPTPALASASRTMVERGIRVEHVLKSFRLAHAAFWSAWMSDLETRVDDPAERMALLHLSWQRVTDWFEAQTEVMVENFEAERARWLQGTHIRRTEMVETLLSGAPVDLDQATSVLGIDVRAVHTALVIWSDPGEPARTSLEETAREFGRAIEGSRVLTVPLGPAALWAWVTGPASPAVEQLRAAAAATGPGVGLACGRTGSGLRGFRDSHHDAVLARRVVTGAASAEAATFYADIELPCLVSGEPDAVRRFVAAELGVLGERDPNSARLRETVRVFLAHGGNARRAADVLFTHKNTVHYRLARAAELLGHPISDRHLELELALRLLDLYGESLLPERH